MSAFLDGRHALIGMIHLPALPGSTAYAGVPFERIVEQAVADARTLRDAGFDAGLLQNTHDRPPTATAPIETVAFLAAIGREIRLAVDWPLGVNILKNDAASALAVAAAVSAAFVRLKVYVGAALGAEGILHAAAPEALRTRQRLATATEIWADLFDRTSLPLVPQPVAHLAEWAVKFGDAQAVIVTGDSWSGTLDMAQTVRRGCPGAAVLIGGGVQAANVREALALVDGVIVGSALEERPFTGPVSAEKARALVTAARG